MNQSKSVLVVGGGGYIGSHMVKKLHEAEKEVIVVDDFSTGFRDSVPSEATIYNIDIGCEYAIRDVFKQHAIKSVIHFAAFSQVGESFLNPQKYYMNNISGTLTLLKVMLEHGVKDVVFSSTAAVYGEPLYTPIDENHSTSPINPYGQSKLMVERILEQYAQSYGLNSICLRYFNAAGASGDSSLGERHDPETHLIPLVLQVASGRKDEIFVFGDDYPTNDGTCIRDYVHVEDLCEAHLLALDYLVNNQGYHYFNLGNEKGASVQEIIDIARQVTGQSISVTLRERRQGDPAVLVADVKKVKQELGWEPVRSSIEKIISDAWEWEKLHSIIWGE